MIKQKSQDKNFVIQGRILLVVTVLCVGIHTNLFALNLDSIKASFLRGDYKETIKEGEKLVATADHAQGADELYYILGLSYIKDGNFQRASDIFEIILNEFSNSKFKEEARMGLGDTYFLRQDLAGAEKEYNAILEKNPDTKLKSPIYYRLSQVALQKGDAQQSSAYLDKLKAEFPNNIESLPDNTKPSLNPETPSTDMYSVQVGSFSDANNASNLRDKLQSQGYSVFIEDNLEGAVKMYRVKVGKFKTQEEAAKASLQLSEQGYPTKICP